MASNVNTDQSSAYCCTIKVLQFLSRCLCVTGACFVAKKIENTALNIQFLTEMLVLCTFQSNLTAALYKVMIALLWVALSGAEQSVYVCVSS